MNNWLFPSHQEEKSETFESIVYRPKTDLKQESYGQNRENRHDTW